ncbi:MAG: hypothetical protein EXQ74_05865 [Thermoleophilia bacterium]|nr:hypothetical protein [Thermoleophilia bacterium]
MGRRLLAGGLGRAVLLLGAGLMVVYGIVAVIEGKTGNGDAQAATAAIMGYAFVMCVLLLWLTERRRRTQPGPVAQEFLMNSREVAEMVGGPVRVTITTISAVGVAAGQVTVDTVISGPDGSGEAAVVLTRLTRRFDVLGADISVAGAHRSITGGGRS